MALHIVRSLGQAFDVCHKLNPKPSKEKKKEEKEETDKEVKEAEEGEANVGEALSAQPSEEPAAKEVTTDLDAAMQKLAVENGEAKGSSEEPQDLISLQFDPFAVTSTPHPNPNNAFLAASVPNGNAMAMNFDPFQPNFTPLAGVFTTPSIPPPPLTMANTSLPELPEEGDVSQLASVPPPHLAYISRPRPRPGTHHVRRVTASLGLLPPQVLSLGPGLEGNYTVYCPPNYTLPQIVLLETKCLPGLIPPSRNLLDWVGGGPCMNQGSTKVTS